MSGDSSVGSCKERYVISLLGSGRTLVSVCEKR